MKPPRILTETVLIFGFVGLFVVGAAPAPHPDPEFVYGAVADDDDSRSVRLFAVSGEHDSGRYDASAYRFRKNEGIFEHSWKLASGGVEANDQGDTGSLMARGCLYEVGAKVYGVGANYGACADTGASLQDGGMEVKVLGFGGKVGKKGVEVCIFVCVEVDWSNWFG